MKSIKKQKEELKIKDILIKFTHDTEEERLRCRKAKRAFLPIGFIHKWVDANIENIGIL